MNTDIFQNQPPSSLSINRESFVYRYRKILFWILIVSLINGTMYFSRSIETRGTGTASVYLARVGDPVIVTLSPRGATPSQISLPLGGSIEFMVSGDSLHNLAEQRSSNRRGDARISSGEFGKGESFLLQFNTSGEFYLYDRLNDSISISIEVR